MVSDEFGVIFPSKAPDGGISGGLMSDDNVLICGREYCPRTTSDIVGPVSEQVLRLPTPPPNTTIGVRRKGDHISVRGGLEGKRRRRFGHRRSQPVACSAHS